MQSAGVIDIVGSSPAPHKCCGEVYGHDEGCLLAKRMTVYEVRQGDMSRTVAARTPSEAATAVIVEGSAAFVPTVRTHDGDTYECRLDVVGHGTYALAVQVPPGMQILPTLGQDVTPSWPSWARPVVGEPWPWKAWARS